MAKGPWVKYQSFVNDVIRDIDKKDSLLRKKAANHVKIKMKSKISTKGISMPGQPPGLFTGNLQKGIGIRKDSQYSHIVGNRAYHAHLPEFGTRTMAKRPYFEVTFNEEKAAIIKILSEERV